MIAAFPMTAPRYLVYAMLDSPHATAATHGFTTGGWTAGPVVRKVIARIAPMLGCCRPRRTCWRPRSRRCPSRCSRAARRAPRVARRTDALVAPGADATASHSHAARTRTPAADRDPAPWLHAIAMRTPALRVVDDHAGIPAASDASPAGGSRRAGAGRRDRRQPAGAAGLPVRRVARRARRRPRLHRRCGGAWRGRRAGAGGHRLAARRAAAAAARGSRAPPPAGADRGDVAGPQPRRWSPRSPAPTARPARSNSCARSGPLGGQRAASLGTLG